MQRIHEGLTLAWDKALFLEIIVAALERRIQQLQVQTYSIHAWSNPGIVGDDDQGNPWATFHCINHTVACHNCGATIDRGWARGRLGEQIYVCSEHMMVSWKHEEG
jgi:hypothetical protein